VEIGSMTNVGKDIRAVIIEKLKTWKCKIRMCNKFHLVYYREVFCKETGAILQEYLKVCLDCGREVGQVYKELA
jgi:hypothetical protein